MPRAARVRRCGVLRRKRTEDEAARHLLAAIVEKPTELAFLNLSRERLQTAGCVCFLCTAAHAKCETNPLHARNLADAAAQLAYRLRESLYGTSAVNLLRASAQCERANALRYLGEFDEAHAALDRAAASLEKTVAPPVEGARVDYIRATLFWKQRNFEEGLRWIRRAAKIFETFGERSSFDHSRMIEANMLFDSGDPLAALAILEPMYGRASCRRLPDGSFPSFATPAFP